MEGHAAFDTQAACPYEDGPNRRVWLRAYRDAELRAPPDHPVVLEQQCRLREARRLHALATSRTTSYVPKLRRPGWMAQQSLVVHQTDEGSWALYAPGTTRQAIAAGDCVALLTGTATWDDEVRAWSRPNHHDMVEAAIKVR